LRTNSAEVLAVVAQAVGQTIKDRIKGLLTQLALRKDIRRVLDNGLGNRRQGCRMTIVTLETRNAERPGVDIAEILKILTALGGAAHLSVIHASLRAEAASNRLREAPSMKEVLSVLMLHRSSSAESQDERLCVYQLFGPDSYRWGRCSMALAEPERLITAQA
jgi:hypothetical protein